MKKFRCANLPVGVLCVQNVDRGRLAFVDVKKVLKNCVQEPVDEWTNVSVCVMGGMWVRGV